jgi:hypothetical protein
VARGANITLLSNASATGDAKAWYGGKGYFTAEATWGGGTVKLQFKTLNSTTWIDVTNISLTANGGVAFELPAGEIRANVATATAVYSYAHPM